MARASSPVVGVVLLVGLTVALVAVVGASTVAFAPPATPPQVTVETVPPNASDAWPEGQRLRLVHGGGDSISVDRLTLVVETDGRTGRLSGFPTRRLTAEHVDGADLFDQGYAGVDGALDAAHTDGSWDAGEAIAVRLAVADADLAAGDRVTVRVVDDRTAATVVSVTLTARAP